MSANCQTKVVIYTDSLKGVQRISEINKSFIPDCRAKGDKVTKTYGYLISDSTHTKWALEVLPKYLTFFKKEELDSLIILPKPW